MLTIATYQGPAFRNQPDAAVEKILSICELSKNADIILFPETFVHGYFDNETDAKKASIDLSSQSFTDILKMLSNIDATIIIGVNEYSGDNIYNSALLIENGNLIGRVRKSSTYPLFDYYSLSDESSVFYKNGIGYGVSICCDINYFSRTNQLAHQGAQIIFCPMWNIISRHHSLVPHMHNKNHLLSKALENKVWLVCSDVIENTEQTLGVGCSCIIDPLGNIVVSAQPLTENILMYHISSFTLQPQYMGLERANQEKYLNKYSAVI